MVFVIRSPQSKGTISHHKLMSKKMEYLRVKPFFKDICHLVLSGSVLNFDVFPLDFFSNKVAIHLYMLSSSMEQWLRCNVNDREVISYHTTQPDGEEGIYAGLLIRCEAKRSLLLMS